MVLQLFSQIAQAMQKFFSESKLNHWFRRVIYLNCKISDVALKKELLTHTSVFIFFFTNVQRPREKLKKAKADVCTIEVGKLLGTLDNIYLSTLPNVQISKCICPNRKANVRTIGVGKVVTAWNS